MTKMEYISFCGDICSLCPRFIATQKNDENELTRVAELWFKLGFRDTIVSNDEIRCNGCTKERYCAHSINSCEFLDDKKNCGECDHFPCDKIAAVFEKTQNYAISCRNKCSEKEYEQLYQAFFMKADILTSIYTAKFDDSMREYN